MGVGVAYIAERLALQMTLKPVVPTFQEARKLCVFIVLAWLFTGSTQAQDQLGPCLSRTSMFGNWEWHTENPSATSPKGSFTFSSEPNSNVVTIRSSRAYPGKGPEFKEMFVIYRDAEKQMSRSMYFDDLGHASQCAVNTSSSCVIELTCRGDGVHMRYVFALRDEKPYFQWQVPPPHRHVEFAPYLGGFLERKKKSKGQ
jgi:hypothetical protein